MQTKFFVNFSPCKHKQLLGSFFSNLSYIKTTQLSMSRKASLPDIDTSQPDVFETDVGVDEVPQQTSVADEFKKRDHDGTKEGPIDHSSVKLNQAFDKFNGKKFEVGAKGN
jgi:hypothetical protein